MREREDSATLLRLFCAVELPQEIRARAARHIASLRERAGDVRASWEREEKLHLTLKFFGGTEEEKVPPLMEALERAASLINSFELALSGTGAFPPSGSPRVLWLGVTDTSSGLQKLQHSIEEECARLGLARERKRFHPHLTIARLRSPEGARRLAGLHQSMEFETEAFAVSEIVLIKSDLGPQGSRYTTMGKAKMKENAEGRSAAMMNEEDYST
jgi:2'-5' RNA ligase